MKEHLQHRNQSEESFQFLTASRSCQCKRQKKKDLCPDGGELLAYVNLEHYVYVFADNAVSKPTGSKQRPLIEH